MVDLDQNALTHAWITHAADHLTSATIPEWFKLSIACYVRAALAAPAATGGESGEAERYRALAVGLQLERDQAQNRLRELEDRLIEATAKSARADGRIEILESALKPSAATGGEAVAWQWRWKFNDAGEWSRWEMNKPTDYVLSTGKPVETRALYARPAPSETGASLGVDATTEELARHAQHEVNAAYQFLRGIAGGAKPVRLECREIKALEDWISGAENALEAVRHDIRAALEGRSDG